MQKPDYAKETEAILSAALPDIPFDGFTDATLKLAAEKAGIDPMQVKLAFPRGGLDLAVAFIKAGNAQMKADLDRAALSDMKIRDRITYCVRTRLEIDTAHKEAARRAFNLLALPPHAVDATKLLSATVDAMWRAAGDTSTDGNFYSKRAILAAVYGATRLVWLNDDSENHDKTWAFLDNRIANVMEFEKAKAKWRDVKEKLPDPLALLSRLRYRG